MKLIARREGEQKEIEIERHGAGYRMRIDGREVLFDLVRCNAQLNSIRFEDGAQYLFGHHADGAKHVVSFDDQAVHVELYDPLALRSKRGDDDSAAGGSVLALMPGRVVRLFKAEGDEVRKGEPLLILEAMKMENEISAPAGGLISKVFVSEGQTVEGGAELLLIEPAGTTS